MQLGLPFADVQSAQSLPHPHEHAPPAVHRLDLQGPSPAPGVGPCVFVRHRRAKRYVLRLDQDGRVRITIPRGGSRKEASAFAERQREWIARERVRLAGRERSVVPSQRSALESRARVELPDRLLELAGGFGLTVARVTIRNQRTRWGSCGRDGHICLNWRLLLMPDWVRDYVLVHELMHLKRMDHSRAYWRLVSDAYPRYCEARQWLRAHGEALR
jgi:predicted metal-dependent hydrolase